MELTVWDGVEGAATAGKVVKTALTGADVIIGTSHALEDYICATIDVIGSISSVVGLVLGNIPTTKKYGTITGSISVGCRTVRWYCQNYGTFWGCTAAKYQGLVHKFNILTFKSNNY